MCSDQVVQLCGIGPVKVCGIGQWKSPKQKIARRF